MKKRIWVIFLCIMITAMLPTVALATDVIILNISDGSIVITSSGYCQGDVEELTPHAGGYMVIQTPGGSTSNTITVESGDIELSLSGVNIKADGQAAIAVKAGAGLNLSLAAGTTNTVWGADGYSGISVVAAWNADAYDSANSAELVISGPGVLIAQGGNATASCGAGAGIGGDGAGESNPDGGDFGIVQIDSGTVQATGGAAYGSGISTNAGAGAGIGGGGIYRNNWSYAGRIFISGGGITAQGGSAVGQYYVGGAAGIGSGASASNSSTMGEDLAIEIIGGTVNATGAVSAAGIGGSANGSSGTITIIGDADITAIGQADNVYGGAGIGGGDNGGSAPIMIAGRAQIFASGSGAAAGIGAGGNGYATAITIQDSAEVIASSTYGAGIGGGGNGSNYALGGNCGAIRLDSSGTIAAYSGSLSQAIGVGYWCRTDASNTIYSQNSLTVGENTGEIWMFTARTDASTFWGQGTGQNNSNIDPIVTAIWYTHPADGGSFPGPGTIVDASPSDGFQWSYADSALSLFSEGNEIASYNYKDGHTLCNWACFRQSPISDITVSPSVLDFSSVREGYAAAPDAQTVVVTNSGNQPITLEQPAATNYDIGKLSKTFLAPGDAATFSVQPQDGLAAGSYDATLAISGSNNLHVQIPVFFEVLVDDETGEGGGRGDRVNSYAILVEDTENGTITSSHNRASHGATVILVVTPEDGYALEALTVSDFGGEEIAVIDKGDGRYSFTMPGSRVVVKALFGEIPARWQSCQRNADCPAYRFVDLDLSLWYHDGIHYCLENGLLEGMSEDIFSPLGTLTRAQAVTVLWRLEGKPAVDETLFFDDVLADKWYSQAVYWAAGEEIVKGYGDGTFRAEAPITREQLAVILYRYAHYKGYNVSVGTGTNLLYFGDAFRISPYAYPALQWTCGAGLLEGNGDGTLNPTGITRRCEFAAMMMRFVELTTP